MSFEVNSLPLLFEAVDKMGEGFTDLPEYCSQSDNAAMSEILNQVATRMQDNYPYHHPYYAGQMLKPPHPVARLAYAMSQWVNPNNHALDGGRASSELEKESVAAIAKMFGWSEFLGHLSSGGTFANLEALWVAGELHPGKMVVASEQAHYTHNRITQVLKIKYQSIPVDQRAKMDLDALEDVLKTGKVGTVVVTLGTTGPGSVDPLDKIIALQKTYGFRIHVDSAYGGYYTLVDELGAETRAAYDAISQVDSIVIDPHKHGLQPYGCGCVLFKDPSVGKIYKHDSPYTYFSSDELHLGEISLECSRAGAAAVALWSTMQLLPLDHDGVFAGQLRQCRMAANKMFELIYQSEYFLTAFEPELDIIIWAPRADKGSEISELSQKFFDRAAEKGLHLALISLPNALLTDHFEAVEFDCEQVTCLRSVLMKPEHLEWSDRIFSLLEETAQELT